MLSPNQIKMQSFPQVGRGAYRAQDVDAFFERLRQDYTALYAENANIKKKFTALSSVVEEYNEGKNAIATALVKAQAMADDTLKAAEAKAEALASEAQEKADALLADAQQEAQTYAEEKKSAADAYFQKAETELKRILSEAETQSQDYVAAVNAQAASIIADANEKAANLVAAAYKDAQAAQDKADEIIARAQVEMQTTKQSISLFKQSALASLGQLLPMVQAIAIDENADAQIAAAKRETLPQVEALQTEAPTFNLDELFQTFDMNVEKDEAALAEEFVPAAIEEIPTEEADAPDDEPEQLFMAEDLPEAPMADVPVYQPIEAPEEAPFTTSLFDTKPSADADDADVEDVPFAADDSPKFAEQDVTDEPQQFKFKLTQTFDIFDEDDET